LKSPFQISLEDFSPFFLPSLMECHLHFLFIYCYNTWN
jgi:hypothetical protein